MHFIARTVACLALLIATPLIGRSQSPDKILKTDPTSEIAFQYWPSAGANRQLKTDPEFGDGYSVHLAAPLSTASAITALPDRPENVDIRHQQTGFTDAQQQIADETKNDGLRRKLENLRKSLPHRTEQADIEETRREILRIEDLLEISPSEGSFMPKDLVPETTAAASPNSTGFVSAASAYSGMGFYPSIASTAPYDWTAGIRNPPNMYSPEIAEPSISAMQGSGIGIAAGMFGPVTTGTSPFGIVAQPDAIAITRSKLSYAAEQIYHQPLIQIKLRVIEVARANGTFSNSILEYVSNANIAGNGSLTSGQPLNGGNGTRGFQNTRGLSRFTVPGLLSNSTTGSGLLVNLTSEHINWVASFLATELDADVVTAPEVVTLNGQNVEFLAGEKVAFELGRNVVTGNNNNIQQLFYKHVGTMVSVTPRIVNWGLYGEGNGEAPLTSQDIGDWNALCEWLDSALKIDALVVPPARTNENHPLDIYKKPQRLPVPLSIRSILMKKLGDYSRRELIERGFPMHEICTEEACRWSPENCTIDLSLVVRLSDAKNTAQDPDSDPKLSGSTGETNVRAVANVVQLKSGHGVVMAGLIGERENQESTKIPGLGDIPYVGALFRSRSTTRLKTEVLVFVEARVLDSQPEIARLQSAEDYRLSQPFVRGELLDNPLECCLQRSGMAPYVCDCGINEKEFWQIHGREVRQAKRHLKDILR